MKFELDLAKIRSLQTLAPRILFRLSSQLNTLVAWLAKCLLPSSLGASYLTHYHRGSKSSVSLELDS